MAASTYLAQVQQLYIAYFGRPADPIGQAYWAGIIDAANGSIAAVQAGFSASTESQALYGNKSTIDKVTAIYNNVFNRAPDAAGLAYWVAQIDSGKVSQAQASWTIQQNAGAGDAATVQNKLTAAQAFTAQIDTAAEISGYQGAGAAAAGVAFLNTVTSVNATATAAVAAAPSAVAAAVAAGGTVGTSFALTAGIDTLTGTANNDTFVAVVNGAATATLSAGDAINGGAGVDTLRVVVSGTPATTNLLAGVTVTNVEKLAVQNASATGVTLAAPTGVTTVSSVNSTAGVAFTGLATGTEVIQSGSATTVAGVLNFSQATAADAVKVTLDGGVNGGFVTNVGGTATSAALNSTGSANGLTGVDTVQFTGGTNTLTTLAVNADAALRATLVAGDYAAAGAALTVTGAAAVNLVGGVFKTIDASANTGGLTVGLSSVTTSFKGSAGNDLVTGTAIAAGATIDGGAGIDSVAATLINATNSSAFKNFELIELGGAGSTTATGLDVGLVTGSTISGVTINSALGANYAVTNLVETAAGFTVGINASAVNNTTLGFTTASVAGTSDVLNYNFAGTTAGNVNGGTITSQGIETLNISSKGATGVTNTLVVTDDAAKSIVITGDKALNLSVTGQVAASATTASALTSIDASAATAGVTITTNPVTTGVQSALTIKGSAFADTITAATSAQANSVGETITTGAGNDNIVVTGASVQSTTALQITTITDFAKGDSLTFGATNATAFNATKVNVTAAASLSDALAIVQTAQGTGKVASWFTYGTDTYVVDNVDGANTLGATDVVVKLTGTLDLSTSTYAAGTGTVTFA